MINKRKLSGILMNRAFDLKEQEGEFSTIFLRMQNRENERTRRSVFKETGNEQKNDLMLQVTGY